MNFNKTTWFILPSLNLSVSDFIKGVNGNIPEYYLYDCFLNFDKDNPKLYIILENSRDTKFRLKLLELKENYYFQEIIEDKDVLTLSFSIPTVYRQDYFTIVSGGYSKVTNTYKQKLLDTYKDYKKSNIAGILNPTKTSIKALEDKLGQPLHNKEICSIIKEEEERIRNMFIVLKPTEDKYKDLAVGYYDSDSGATNFVCNVSINLFDKDKVAEYIVDSLNKNIENLDVKIVK